jgi:hypothetical protein
MVAIMKRRGANRAFAILLALTIADLYRAPLRTREAPPLPQAYTTLARLPRGPVIEVPYWSESIAFHRHAEYMLTSTAHWQPLINGYSDHIPQDFRDNAPVLATFPSAQAFAALQPLGARYVVVHLDLYDRATREDMIKRLDSDYANYLRPLDKSGDVWLYEINGWPR